MTSKALGLLGKFHVERTDGRSAKGEKHDGCDYFVLDLTHDPLAFPAIAAYEQAARIAGYEALADDLIVKLVALRDLFFTSPDMAHAYAGMAGSILTLAQKRRMAGVSRPSGDGGKDG